MNLASHLQASRLRRAGLEGPYAEMHNLVNNILQAAVQILGRHQPLLHLRLEFFSCLLRELLILLLHPLDSLHLHQHSLCLPCW
jgi:hypothetical protein